MSNVHPGLLAASVMALAVLSGCGGGSPTAPGAPPVATLREQTDAQRVTASGIVAPVDAGAQMDAAVTVTTGVTVNSP